MNDELDETIVLTQEANFVESDDQALANLSLSVQCLATAIGDLLSGGIKDEEDRLIALNLIEVSNGLAYAVDVYTGAYPEDSQS
jgi:hypothetical protein